MALKKSEVRGPYVVWKANDSMQKLSKCVFIQRSHAYFYGFAMVDTALTHRQMRAHSYSHEITHTHMHTQRNTLRQTRTKTAKNHSANIYILTIEHPHAQIIFPMTLSPIFFSPACGGLLLVASVTSLKIRLLLRLPFPLLTDFLFPLQL